MQKIGYLKTVYWLSVNRLLLTPNTSSVIPLRTILLIFEEWLAVNNNNFHITKNAAAINLNLGRKKTRQNVKTQ